MGAVGISHGSSRRRGWIRIALTVLVLLVVWEGVSAVRAVMTGHGAPMTLPYPHRILSTFVSAPHEFLSALWYTIRGALEGLAVGVGAGLLVAFIAAQASWLETGMLPYLIVSQMVPTVVLAPIVLAVVHNPNVTRIIVAAYISFFAITINTIKGLKVAKPDEASLLRSLAASRWQMNAKLRLPAALPFFFAGLKIAAPLSVVGEVVVELAGANNGLGYLTLTSLYYGASQAYVFWTSVVITLLLGTALYGAVVLSERLLTPWQVEFRDETAT